MFHLRKWNMFYSGYELTHTIVWGTVFSEHLFFLSWLPCLSFIHVQVFKASNSTNNSYAYLPILLHNTPTTKIDPSPLLRSNKGNEHVYALCTTLSQWSVILGPLWGRCLSLWCRLQGAYSILVSAKLLSCFNASINSTVPLVVIRDKTVLIR